MRNRILLGTLLFALLLFVCFGLYQTKIANAQGDIGVQLITSGSAYVFEHYASYDGVTGDPNVNVEVPCENVRDKERQTILLYGVMVFPDSDGSGAVNLWFTPSRGIDWGGVITSFPNTIASSTALTTAWAVAIYPGCKAKFMWTNPGTIKWKLVYYTRALVN
jgi:hypothetical protein